MGDFNVHHSDRHDPRTDPQGENISRACDSLRLIMNDGSPTFLSSPDFFSSVIDLSIASGPLALLADVEI